MSKKIHIGFHKAGSTFLQQIVFPKVPNYKGRYYPKRSDNHNKLYNGKRRKCSQERRGKKENLA